jgi:hypothetical protein
MVTWRRVPDDGGAAEWAALLAQASDVGPFQAWAWGEYKRERGWLVERWLAVDDNDVTIACLQALVKRLPFGRTLAWVPGGPVIGFPKRTAGVLGPLVFEWLARAGRDRGLVYARFASALPSISNDAYAISRVCARPRFPIVHGYTVAIDLTRSADDLRASMSAKHRYYVKRGEGARLRWVWGNTDGLAADLERLYVEMARAKDLRVRAYAADLPILRRTFGDDLAILVGYRDAEPVTGCMVLMTGQNAFYLIAATGEAGRRVSAAYAMVWELLGRLQSRTIASFDFGGLSPGSSAAAGVDHFKRGFGGQVVEYLGEWEFASSRPVSRLFGFLAARRGLT